MIASQHRELRRKFGAQLRAEIDGLGGTIADGTLVSLLLLADLHAAMAVVDGMEFEEARTRLVAFVSDAYATAWPAAQQEYRNARQVASN